MNENEAIQQTIENIIKFDKDFGRNALEQAIHNGAFHEHKEYGDVSEIFIYRDFNDDSITVPQWISDIFIAVT